MPIIMVGLNHRTAPVEVREQLSLAGMALQEALVGMVAHRGPGDGQVREAVILSTCNRFEIYGHAADASAGLDALEQLLARCCGLAPDRLGRHVYRRVSRDAIHHLMRVAVGLDSLVLGETQILGQVANACGAAQSARSVGPILTHLFSRAVHTGRRARRETSVCGQTTSISHAAALLVQQQMGDLGQARVLVVGAGEMAELGARALHLRGARDIACLNRTVARAEELARRVEGHSLEWHRLAEGLAWADVVLTATGAPHTVVRVEDVRAALRRRDGRPLWLVDVAVPRDVDDAVVGLPGVHHFDVDDLQAVVDANLAERQAAVPQVEAIVAAELGSFLDWLGGREVVPVIVDLRRRATEMAEAEVTQALNRLEELNPRGREVVSLLAHRIVTKLLHEPTTRLKTQAASGNGHTYAQVVRELFALDSPPRLRRESQEGWGEVVASHV